MEKRIGVQVKVILSLFAVLVGWGVGFLFFALVEAVRLGGKWPPIGMDSIVLWSGIFTFVAWNIFCLPLVIVLESWKIRFPAKFLPLFSAFYGVFAYMILIAWWTGLWRDGFTVVTAAIIGGVTGLIYSLSYQKSTGGEAKKSEPSAGDGGSQQLS